MEFGEKLAKMFSEGLGDIGQELARMGVQGQAELASALFTGNSYVPYGQGQNRPSAVHGLEGLHSKEKEEIQHENDGRSM
jgi:hypothetical protein